MRASLYLRKYLYIRYYRVYGRVVLIGGFKITYDSKIKLLFLLIVCICFFVSASCIFAADNDDGLANDSNIVEESIDDQSVIISDAVINETADSDMSDNHSAANVHDSKNHGFNSTNKTVSLHHDKKSVDHVIKKAKLSNDRQTFSKNSDLSGSEDARHHHKNLHGERLTSKRPDRNDAGSHHRQHVCTQQTAEPDVAKTEIKTDVISRLCANTTDSFTAAASHNHKMTEESEICWCGDSRCGHNSNHHSHDEVYNNSVSADSLINNDMTYSFSCFYSQINTASEGLIRSRNGEEEFMDEKNQNSILFSSDVAELENANHDGPSHMDLNINLTDSFSSDLAQLESIGLDIESLYSTNLDIKDYNLEYYMFSNPDIIIKADIFNLPKTSTPTFNTDLHHCPENADVKTILDSYLFFNQELSAISEDNFCHKAFSLSDDNEINLMLIAVSAAGFEGHSPFILSNDGNVLSFLLNFGGIQRCLI